MYMLLQVDKEENGLVNGVCLQWCCACTLEEAAKRARETEKVNSNRISVAVVDELYTAYTYGIHYTNLQRLDVEV